MSVFGKGYRIGKSIKDAGHWRVECKFSFDKRCEHLKLLTVNNFKSRTSVTVTLFL